MPFRFLIRPLPVALAAALFIFPGTARQLDAGRPSVSTVESIHEDAIAGPCDNAQRQAAAIALFKKMGATDADIKVEKFKDVENVVLTLEPDQPGDDGLLVVGAHYDKVKEGCGAIDNWTGITIVAHLYRSFKKAPRHKKMLFVAFGREEEGLIGSKAMVKAIPKENLPRYCAMVNLDSFGQAAPQVISNISTGKLTDLAERIAKERNITFAQSPIDGVDADSSAFRDRKIPAVTLHGLSNNFWELIHTKNDTADKIKPISTYLGYRLAFLMLVKLDAAKCREI
jgi:Iap family predicted aminopeptidase